MRLSVTCLLVWTFATTIGSQAEVIHLKNGRIIWADHVQQDGSRLQYDVGDNSYAIPKSLVANVEAGGIAPQSASAEQPAEKELPTFDPADNIQNEASIVEKVVHDGRVDPDALSELEKQGNTGLAAIGYFLAGKMEFERQNFSKARTYLQSALRLDPENPTILNYYASLLVRTGNAVEALTYAERSVRISPNSPDSLAVLGFAQYAADRNRDAIRSWKRALEIRPDANVQKLLEKAERDAQAEADFTQRESSHFTLRYEGRQTTEAFRQQLTQTLEAEYDELVRQLGTAPRSSIPVVLYTDQAFFDVTQAPAWTSAINDGKLRIPVEGVSTVTPELARVLKHELAHSFINQLSGGRCPQWLHEGIAQVIEPRTVGGSGRQLAQLFATHQNLPYNTLEGSFMRLSPNQAALAYAESLAAAEYVNETYGMSDLRRVLELLGEGISTEAALRTSIHSGYAQLESEVGRFLASKYGD